MNRLLGSAASRHAFRLTLIGIGGIAVGTGAWAFVSGSSGLPGPNAADPTVDQELRFLAVFWMVFGVALLCVRDRITKPMVRAIAIAIFLGGAARGLSLLTAGTPHPMFVALMWIELIGPLWLVFWHAQIDAPRRDH